MEIETRKFDRPDDHMDFQQHGSIDMIRMADGTVGMRGILKPGWTWEGDEKPLLGNPDSCPMAHTGYCLSGELVVRSVRDRKEVLIQKGDFFVIPPEHDAFVPGDEACVLVMFQAPEGTGHTH